MRCPSCQSENPDGAPFCGECGLRLSPGAVGADQPTGAIPAQTVLQDRYVIVGRLGQGGMGAVYRATDRHLGGVSWAIKEMSQAAIPSPLERQQAREAFRREAEMLAALAQPNLPRVIDHFEQDGKAYLVMEFVPGETLLSLLQREGAPQPLPRVFEWARQLCDALEYLHAQNPPIIFRDLKPDNIIITPQGQIKLIDFGIARLFKPGQARDTQAFGTVGYSAPEQYGRGQTDARSDVYALGVLLHQLLTGHDPVTTPFHPPPAGQANPRLPRQVATAIDAATASEPSMRFPSVRAFRDALLGATSDAPALAGVGGAIYARPDAGPYLGFGALPAPPSRAAQSGRWIGVASLALMVVGFVLALIARVGGNVRGALAGVGYLIGAPGLIGAPVALILGIVALTRAPADPSPDNRRLAMFGVITGFATLLLCCILFVIVGSAPRE